MFLLAAGVSLSIMAGFGVSPVSALAYALALTSGFSVGLMTFATNLFYLVLQDLFKKTADLKVNGLQLIMSVLFGVFVNLTLAGFQVIFPVSSGVILRSIYLAVSLIVIALGLFFLFSTKLPVLPYDGLTAAISKFFNWKMGKAKVISDLINVTLAAVICLIFLGRFGSIGLGTLVSAILIGRIMGFFMDIFQARLQRWITGNSSKKSREIYVDSR